MKSKQDILTLLQNVLQSNTSKLSKQDKRNIKEALSQAGKAKKTSANTPTGISPNNRSYWDAIYYILKVLGIGSDFFD